MFVSVCMCASRCVMLCWGEAWRLPALITNHTSCSHARGVSNSLSICTCPAFASFTCSCNTAVQPAVKPSIHNTKSEFTCFHVCCLLLMFAVNTCWSLSLKEDLNKAYSKCNLRHHHASGRSSRVSAVCMRCFQQYKKFAAALNAYIKYEAHEFV